ncbi:hypothetical protein PGO_094450 [Plasmodium gonderi]|uniref:Variable surface protein n=1 Tax=Plasmodium gonderi TaxID=77519 RepID=A0A1Y1JMI7_PLAGO|nr:hypothetical protein PGO_094450 [Plasmodium gonderi]GAW81244.1 hypothetical protein PGO_094450 [Plasmodium gonderi]
MKINAYKMGTITVSTYENNGALDINTCLEKYTEILAYIKENFTKSHENLGECRKLNKYIIDKSNELNGCNIGGGLILDLHDDSQIKNIKLKCEKFSEDTSNPAFHEQQDTKLKREEGLSEESKEIESERKHAEEVVSQQKCGKALPVHNILEQQRTGEDGKIQIESYGSTKGQVLPQEQPDVILHAREIGTPEEKSRTKLSEHSGKSGHEVKEPQPLSVSYYQGTSEVDFCQYNTSSHCNLEGKSGDVGVPQANAVKKGFLQSNPHSDNTAVFSTVPMENLRDKHDDIQNAYRQDIITKSCNDLTLSGSTRPADHGDDGPSQKDTDETNVNQIGICLGNSCTLINDTLCPDIANLDSVTTNGVPSDAQCTNYCKPRSEDTDYRNSSNGLISIISNSSKCDASESSDSITPLIDDHGKIQNISMNHNYYFPFEKAIHHTTKNT